MPININKLAPELYAYIHQKIIPQYSHFDKAHGTKHAQTVIKESMKLAVHYDVDLCMVYTIAAYHDLGLCEGRESHHLVSGRMLMNDTVLKQWFSEEQLTIMKEAIEDHRASNKHVPRSIYGKIVAEADRIIRPDITLRRTVQYGLSHYPEQGKEEQYTRFREHLNNKYAEGGYLKLWFPESSNTDQLKELRRLIKDKEKLYKLFENIYDEELSMTQV